jgi:hypothetical protein
VNATEGSSTVLKYVLRGASSLCVATSVVMACLGIAFYPTTPAFARYYANCSGCPVSCANSANGVSCFTPGFANCPNGCACQTKICQ